MTEAHEPNEIDGPHEGPIKTPKQLILAVLYAFVVPIFGIILLVMFVTADKRPAAGSDAFDPKAVAERIRPVGSVEVKDVTDVASLKTGEQVFSAQCTACHTAGALGAPKLGDADAWAPRTKTGFDALLHSALTGKGQMPPQGGGDFTDFEIARAVVYMANKGGGKFNEPAAPSAAASAAATHHDDRERRRADARTQRRHADRGADRWPQRAGGQRAGAGRRGCNHRRAAGAVRADLQRLPCHRCRRRAEGRRQGGLGAADRRGYRRR